jgi:LuxR family maltose regulon positive regulatory protein
MEQLPPQTRDFLLDTCVLARLEPRICTALTSDANAPLILHELASANLFLLPLAEDKPFYRYHPLFSEFLCQYLALHDNERLLIRHRRAAEWYAAHDQIASAVTHALDAGDHPFAARLIEDGAWPMLTSRGEIETIVRWLPRFSEESLREFPRLTLYFSRALYLTSELEQSRIYVQMALASLDEQGITGDEERSLRAIAFSYQATLEAYQGQIQHGLSLIAQSEALQDATSPLDRVRIANTRAFLHYLRGDIVAARQGYELALELARQIGHHYLVLDAIGYLAQLDLMQGALHKAQRRCSETLAQYPTPIAPLCTVMLPLASVCFEQNRIDEAEALVREAIDLAQRGTIPDLLWRAHALLATILASRGEWEKSLAEVQRTEQITSRFRSAFMPDYVGAIRVRIALLCGKVEQALAWSARDELSANDSVTAEYQRDFEQLTLARLWLKQGRQTEALELLQQACTVMQSTGRLGNMVEARLLEALLHEAAGKSQIALHALAAALRQAEPEAQIRPFLEFGESLRALLMRASAQGIEPVFVHTLLARIPEPQRVRNAGEILTQREIEVLQEIAVGRSNQEIADLLVVSVGTVKSHLNHIMDKLDARNRTEAVAKARLLNLFDK